MMQTVASHKSVNRMSISAVAACMAPLLLRPLLAGECELDHDFDVGADGSLQLLQAAAAANHAQAIVITLLEEYRSIFGVCSIFFLLSTLVSLPRKWVIVVKSVKISFCYHITFSCIPFLTGVLLSKRNLKLHPLSEEQFTS